MNVIFTNEFNFYIMLTERVAKIQPSTIHGLQDGRFFAVGNGNRDKFPIVWIESFANAGSVGNSSNSVSEFSIGVIETNSHCSGFVRFRKHHLRNLSPTLLPFETEIARILIENYPIRVKNQFRLATHYLF